MTARISIAYAGGIGACEHPLVCCRYRCAKPPFDVDDLIESLLAGAEVLRAAKALLEQQSGEIADPARRRVFREQVAAHQTILAALVKATTAS